MKQCNESQKQAIVNRFYSGESIKTLAWKSGIFISTVLYLD